jgi:hypothetical protein
MKISKFSPMQVLEFQKLLQRDLDDVHTLEEAAQVFVETIYHNFKESIVLLRLFVTIPAAELPEKIYAFAENMAESANSDINRNPYILTLFGTVGVNPRWNDRTNSQEHQGIPLATPDFVTSIPMMSALLEQMGFDLGWIRGDPEIVAKKMGKLAGTFYVAEAGTAKDSKNRPIIPARDFISKYEVHTVFGVGGGFITSDKFLTTIFFLREYIDKETAVLFQGLANVFKLKTQKFIQDKSRYFRFIRLMRTWTHGFLKF